MAKGEIRKKAYEAYGRRVGEWIPATLLLLIVGASVAALSLLGSLWVIVGVGLLFLPALFGVTRYLGATFGDQPVQTNVMTRGFGAYFRLPFVGVYRFLLNALLALVSTIGVWLAFTMAYYLVCSYLDPDFSATIDSIYAAMGAGDVDAARSALDSSGAFGAMYDISAIVMGFALAFFCWLYYGKYAQNAIIRNAFSFNNPRLSNYFYRYYRLAVKRDWIKERAPFFLYPLGCLVLGASVSVVCYRFGVKANLSTFFGLLAFAALFSLYLPLGLYLQCQFAFAHEKSVGRAYYEGSKRIYQSYASMGRANPEELEKMREELERMKPKEDDEEGK